MGLFKADLYRFFILGFVFGALLVGMGTDGFGSGVWSFGLVPVAVAAPAR